MKTNNIGTMTYGKSMSKILKVSQRLFQRASKDYVRIYVHRQARISMAKELFKVLQENTPHEWTKEEIED